jgi:hypothetical protein
MWLALFPTMSVVKGHRQRRPLRAGSAAALESHSWSVLISLEQAHSAGHAGGAT